MALRTLLARFRVKYGPRVEYEGAMCEYIMGYFRKHPTADQWPVRLPLSTFCGMLYRQAIRRSMAARRKAAELISQSNDLSPMVFGAAYELLKHHVASEEVNAVCALAASRAVQNRNLPLLRVIPITLSWLSQLVWVLLFGSLSDLDSHVLNSMHADTRGLFVARRRPQLTVDHFPALSWLISRFDAFFTHSEFTADRTAKIVRALALTDPRKAMEVFCQFDCSQLWYHCRDIVFPAFDEQMANDDRNYADWPRSDRLWMSLIGQLPGPVLDIVISKLWHVKGHNYNPHRWWLQGHSTMLPATVIAIVQRLKENEPTVASE
jgi:hypothetical protein